MSNKKLDITLTEKQSLVFKTTVNELFFGGAAGPGKTFVNKVLAISVCLQVPGAQVAILRNTSKNLVKNYLMGSYSIPDILRENIKQKSVNINHSQLIVNFDNGSAIHLMHAEHVPTTIENLTGIEFALIIVDEAALIDREIILFSKSRLRLGSLKIENEFWKERLPRLQLSSNPGGISHGYLKSEYIDPAPPMTEFFNEAGNRCMFIPAFASDNKHVDADAYKRQLLSMDDPIKYAQLAEGDWNAGGASFFGDAFKRTKNVIPDFTIPHDWSIYRAYDPGFSSPFGYVIMARVKGQNTIEFIDGSKKYIPNDSIIVYREWYGYKGGKDMNEGLRWQHDEIAETMKAKEEGWGLKGRVKAGRADWRIWDGELSVYSEYEKRGITFIKADKAKGSRTAGALKMREMMFNAHEDEWEKPVLVFVDKCIHCISTIPDLPTDPKNPDDVVTEGVPDHLYDAVRYEVMSERKAAGFLNVIGT